MPTTSTRKTLGEKKTLKGLVEHTLTDFAENNASNISLRKNAFGYNDALETVRIGGSFSANSAGSFFASSALSGIIAEIESGAASTSSTFIENLAVGSNIGKEIAALYVPDGLLATYQANAMSWNYPHLVRAISEYPLTDFSTVDDSWAEIVAAAANGTHSSLYPKRTSIKKLTYGGYTVYMQYIGDRNEGPVWAVKNFAETRPFHTSNISTYGGSAIDTYVNETVFELLPSAIQNGIATVPIITWDATTSAEVTLNRKVWLLSTKELNFTGSSLKETNGYTFSDAFDSNDSHTRLKYNRFVGSASSWWTRSSYSSTNPMAVSYNGIATNGTATTTWGVVFGFCLSGPSN